MWSIVDYGIYGMLGDVMNYDVNSRGFKMIGC